MTTHICIKTYFVRDRTGELRPLSTKTFIVKNLKHDLLSGKALNKAGYRVTYAGYELWHRRLGHCSNRNIRDTIHHSAGLEELMSRKFDPHMKCPSCMIGKSTLEDLPKLEEHALKPLGQVYMDSFSSSVTSIDGYNHIGGQRDVNLCKPCKPFLPKKVTSSD